MNVFLTNNPVRKPKCLPLICMVAAYFVALILEVNHCSGQEDTSRSPKPKTNLLTIMKCKPACFMLIIIEIG